MQTIDNLENYIIKINSEFKEMLGGSYVKLNSGEIFSSAELKAYQQRKIEVYQAQIFNKNIEVTRDILGIESDQRIVNRRSKKPNKKASNSKATYLTNNHSEFNMVHRNKIKEVSNMQLNKNEKLVYYVLRDFVQHPTNCVMINNEIPTFTDLAPLTSLTERTVRECLKALEQKCLLKLVQSGHRKAIYINPEYYATGKELNITTLQLFGLVDFDVDKVEMEL